ncbi:MAG TPA: DMT family transporter [Ktedonobacterales bacterium]
MASTGVAAAPARGGSMAVYAALWFSQLAWGASWVAARMVLHAGAPDRTTLSPTVLAALRFALAALFFVPSLAWSLRAGRLSVIGLLRLAALGQLTFTVYFWLQYTGVQLTDAGIAAILVVGLIPAATAALAHALRDERLTRLSALALALGLAGVVIIQAPSLTAGGLGAAFSAGALCLVADAAAFAVYSTLSKRWMSTISPMDMTGGTMVGGAVGLLLLSLVNPAVNRWSDVARLSERQWVAVLFLALVCSIGAYVTYNFALSQIPAPRAALYIYFEPVITVALAAVLLGERLSLAAIVGALIIALSVVLFQIRSRTSAAPIE